MVVNVSYLRKRCNDITVKALSWNSVELVLIRDVKAFLMLKDLFLLIGTFIA